MKPFYRPRCKGCDKTFKVNKLKKIVIESPFGSLEMDIENVVQNNYSQVFDTPQGKAVMDLKDIEIDLVCHFCSEIHKYSLRSLTLTDRLD